MFDPTKMADQLNIKIKQLTGEVFNIKVNSLVSSIINVKFLIDNNL